MMRWLLIAGLGVEATGPCNSQREINRDSVNDIEALNTVCGSGTHAAGCMQRVDCTQTNAACSAENPLFVPHYVADAPWKHIFGQVPNPSITDKNVKARVIPPEMWWRLPTAVLMYERNPLTWVAAKDPKCPDTLGIYYCVVPARFLSCARELAPELAYPVPKGSLGEVVGLDGQPRALFTFNKRRVDSEALTKHLVADDDFGTDVSRAAVLLYLERCIPWGG
jgi:hypothetical protein